MIHSINSFHRLVIILLFTAGKLTHANQVLFPDSFEFPKKETSLVIRGIASLVLGKEFISRALNNKKTAAATFIGAGIVYGAYQQYKYKTITNFVTKELKGATNAIEASLPTSIQWLLKKLFEPFLNGITHYASNNKWYWAIAAAIKASSFILPIPGLGYLAPVIILQGHFTQESKKELNEIKKETQEIKEAVNNIDKKVDQLQEGQEQLKTTVQDQGEKTRETIEKEVSSLSSDLARLKEEMKTGMDTLEVNIGKKIEDFSAQLHHMPEKIVSLLQDVTNIKAKDIEHDNKIDGLTEQIQIIHNDILEAQKEFPLFLQTISQKIDSSTETTKNQFEEVYRLIESIQKNTDNSAENIKSEISTMAGELCSQGKALDIANGKLEKLFDVMNMHYQLLQSLQKAHEIVNQSLEQSKQTKDNQDVELIKQIQESKAETKKALTEFILKLKASKKNDKKATKEFFEGVEKRVSRVESRLDQIEPKIDKIEESTATIVPQVGAIVTQVGALETQVSENHNALSAEIANFAKEWRQRYEEMQREHKEEREKDRKKYEEEREKDRKQILGLQNTIIDLTKELGKTAGGLNQKIDSLDDKLEDQKRSTNQLGAVLLQEIRQSKSDTLFALHDSQTPTNNVLSVPIASTGEFGMIQEKPYIPKQQTLLSSFWG